MDVQILGADAIVLPLVESFRDSDQFEVTGWFESQAFHRQLKSIFPAGRDLGTADDLIGTVPAGLVVVGSSGRNTESREAVLRELARQGVPLAMAQPSCSAIFAFELDMIQRDTGAPIIPLYGPSLHPAVGQIAQWSANSGSSPVGPVEQIIFEREATDRSDEAVRAALAQDALLLRQILGNFGEVGAMQAGAQNSLANLSVHFTGESRAIARWSIGPAADTPRADVTLVGKQGKLTLQMPGDAAWAWAPSNLALPELADFDSQSALVQHLQDGLSKSPATPVWEDACRAIDLAELAGESLRRKKTIAVSNERLTEEDTFKGIMAAGGCLIILVIPFIFGAIALLEGLKIPLTKTLEQPLLASQTLVQIPVHIQAIERIELVDVPEPLTQVSMDTLESRWKNEPPGTPRGFAFELGSVTVAPPPDQPVQMRITYLGTFSLWRGWPLVLLTPILAFLALQLLKFVFPPKVASESA